MQRFFLFLSIGVTLGVLSIVTRASLASQSVEQSLRAQTAQSAAIHGEKSASAQKTDLSTIKESTDEAFSKTLQEEWPLDVGACVLLSLALSKIMTSKQKQRQASTQAAQPEAPASR